uniref:Uncharacterized protein n=1 Tax=Callorhinchus milii TaxID=7868 RepID=A0A4W3GCT7_CALMI
MKDLAALGKCRRVSDYQSSKNKQDTTGIYRETISSGGAIQNKGAPS